MGEVDEVRDMSASLLAEVGFSCSFNVGRKVRYLGYQLHFKCGRILILYIAPLKALSRRFTLRLTEHFSRYEEMERGLSQREVVTSVVTYLESLFVGLLYFFQLSSNRNRLNHVLFAQMKSVTLGLLQRYCQITIIALIGTYGYLLRNQRNSSYIRKLRGVY